ncbi:MAG: DUF2628 domain-containing protein [Clostridia bacterium]|nr:DUF2628 domain-containing protein [Clostridia bacterium]
MKYDGVQCPVCLKTFDASSDVVVCPECGTPHHRECYEKNGECINAAKHGTDFAWVSPIAPEVPEEKPEPQNAPVPVPSFITKGEAPKNGVIGEMRSDGTGNQFPEYREIRGNEKIGDYTVDDYAKVIDKNVPRFMPKFMAMDRRKRKVSWNWAALIFGPLYLAYRKMYKPAILSMLVILFIPMIFMSDITDFYKETYAQYNAILSSDAYETTEEMSAALEDLQNTLPQPPYALTTASYIETAVDILCALYANYLYKKHCENVLKKAATLDEAKREKFIKRRGGRSLLGILVLILAFYAAAIVVGIIYYIIGSDLATVLRKLIK